MNISPEDFGALFDSFDREAFRLESLDDYTGSSSAENLRACAAGEEKPADYNAGWLAQVGRNTAAGKRMHRVHIVTCPLTNYIRYELDWGYLTNITAGEDVRRDPFAGIGKPEPLKYHLPGAWSRRIDAEHRLVYLVTDREIVILAARYHY
ncbi:Txe/YoeB family addiction module toxin [Streptacidiphilus albus]|uniref:Txe/YoeB family addiction module toxin n=1 Tax=Streptacidiphilus albus TaxID=105425 RepID=UPI00068BB5FD